MRLNINQRKSFFFYINLSFLIIVVLGFSSYAIIKKPIINASLLIIIIHSFSLFLWYSFIVYQSHLVSIKKIEFHKKLGVLSIIIAVIVFSSGIMMGIKSFEIKKNSVLLYANIILIVLFGIFYTLAIIFRKNLNIHKRLILFASFSMMAPAISRVLKVLNLDEMIISPFIFLTFIFSLIIYDYIKIKRVYIPTFLSISVVVLALLSVEYIGKSEKWNHIIISIFGQ